MTRIAVPEAIGRSLDLNDGFREAAPGHRFLMYLPMWKPDWSLDKGAKASAARACCPMPTAVGQLRAGVCQRQGVLAAAQGALTIEALSTAPFATGLGNEHPIENGFAFLTPYGLPYLAGSGLKGVLRRAAQELEADRQSGFTKPVIAAVFGVEEVNRPEDARRGALDCWDCFPEGDLVVEIMTPHQGGYYQNGQTPHDAGQPVPVPFLAVKAGAKFVFHVVCHEQRLTGEAEVLRNGHWREWLAGVFAHAFDWLGFGAKTSVGYGAMTEDPAVREQRFLAAAAAHARAAAQAEADRLAALTPEDQAWDQARPVVKAFSDLLAKAKAAGAYNPSGPFNQERLKFVKQVLSWTELRSRLAAADLIEQSTTKAWGRPSNKDRWQELQAAITTLRGPA
jgi:CRISPR-associated protein Cmr6